jgi:ADP-ribose pyrophosphatase YjhB (NUDIX family)
MSLEIDVHSAQVSIMRELLFHPSAGFAELQKPTGLDSDHFKFHINRLVELGYVEKQDGKYALSIKGKEYANRLDTEKHEVEKQPKISVGLIIENDEGKILAQQRLKQPFYGYWGRPTGKVGWGETLLETAARELMEETGITADLRVSGFYHKMDYTEGEDKLLEDKIFCLVHGTNPRGELIADMEGHHNEWLSDEELLAKDKVFESITEITDLARKPGVGFIEQKYFYDQKDY